MEKLLSVVQQNEQLAADILAKRAEVVNLDRRRNKNREASRAIKNLDKSEKKLWLSFGNMFVKTPVVLAEKVIDEDQTQINETIDNLRDEIKKSTESLRKMEGKETVGYNLKSLAKNESAAMRDLLPSTM